jgi:hypothetical protein
MGPGQTDRNINQAIYLILKIKIKEISYLKLGIAAFLFCLTAVASYITINDLRKELRQIRVISSANSC